MASWCLVLFLVAVNGVVAANVVDGDSNNDASIVAWSDKEEEPARRRTQESSCGHHVDFQSKADGQLLSAGDIIDDSVSFVGGLTLKANRLGSSGFSDGMIFSSFNPTGRDADLTNFPFLENIFIISADGDSDDPDDAGNGGEILLTFADPVVMDSMRFLDIEEVDGDVGLFDPDGAFIAGFKIPRMLNGGQKVVSFLRNFLIGSLKIRFRGSGAIDDIKFTPGSCFPPQTQDSLLQLLADASPDGGRLLRTADPTTPQYQAFQWLFQDMQGKGYSDGRKLQRYALAVFYFATGGPDYVYGSETPWLTPGHECGWALTHMSTQIGSTNTLDTYDNACDTDNPRSTQPVTRLIIPQQRNLLGTIPPEIAMLTSLQTLLIGEHLCVRQNLSCKTGLQGTIPTEIGLLENLVSMQIAESLGGSTFGILPTEILRLSNLEILDVQGLGLTGTIHSEIGTRLSKLEWIGMGYNKFTGSIPSELVLLPNLRSLILTGNQLVGEIPPVFLDIKASIQLYDNDLDYTSSICEPPRIRCGDPFD